MNEKICTKCKKLLPLEENFHPRYPNGYQSWCHKCKAAALKLWRAKNPEKIAAAQKRWYNKNRPARYQHTKTWRAKNPEKYAEINRRNSRKRRQEDPAEEARKKRFYYWNKRVKAAKPKTRGDCENGPRPCFWISCHYHLFFSLRSKIWRDLLSQSDTATIDFIRNDMGETCTLDVADRDGVTMDEICEIIRVSRQRIHQMISFGYRNNVINKLLKYKETKQLKDWAT